MRRGKPRTAAPVESTGENLICPGSAPISQTGNIGGSGMHMQQQNLPLNHLAVLEFRGRDAGRFLQAQLTADIASLEVGASTFACCCNPAGRVLGLLLLKAQGEDWFAICAADLAASLREWLGRYVLRAKVAIIERTDLGVAALPHAAAMSPATIPLETPQGRYAIVPGGELTQPGRDEDGDALRCDELLAGVAWLDAATSGQFLPQMLGMERIGALSFRKGCFPGQEIIARTRYLGKLKRHPLLCLIEGAFEAGPLENVELRSGEQTVSAVLVDRVAFPHKADTLAYLVMRGDPDFAPQTCVVTGREHAVRWSGAPGPDTRLPDATP